MNSKIKKLVGIGLFTAIVAVLQLLGGSIHFGIFSISLVLVPIVVGAAVYGWQAGAWLGFAFGAAVLKAEFTDGTTWEAESDLAWHVL